MKTRLTAGLVIIATVLLGCTTGGGTGTATPPESAGPPADASPTAPAFDQAFIDMMVPHHQSATEMAKLAQERAEHEELGTLAGEIITAQESEIEQMKRWRTEWFGSADTPPMEAMPVLPGVEMPGMPDHGMDTTTMDMTADIEILRDADPFDLAFLDAMMVHHQSAIDAANIALGETERPEIRSLAEDIVASQQAELEQMEAWRTEWYPEAS